MKCLILAAGYATRLYPLTENFPKPLLEVGGKPILDWLIEDLEKSALIDEYMVVSNHKFAHIFQEWVSSHPSTLNSKLSVLDDGTSSNETRLGAVRDIQLAIDEGSQRVNGESVNGESVNGKSVNSESVNGKSVNGKSVNGKFHDDLLVMAGDNLLSFSLCDFLAYARQKGTSCIMRYYEPDGQRLHKSGVAEVDDNDRILSMEEKPAEPKSHWCCPPFYYIVKTDVPKVAEAIDSGCGVDAPGSFIAWLCQQTAVHAWEMPGPRYDIGNLESYEAVKKIFNR